MTQQQAVERDSIAQMPQGPLGIIALESCRELGANVNDFLIQWHNELDDISDELYTFPGLERDTYLVASACPRFGTGEGKGVIRETVRGYDIFIIVDIGNYGCSYKLYGKELPMSPDDHFQDLKRIISAIGGKARRVSVVMPMLYEGRQHRRISRESLDCAIALQELERLGVQNIITFDAHDPRVQNAVPLISFENVLPSYQILKALLRDIPDLKIHRDHMLTISPDEGAIDRNIYYSTVLGINMGLFYKRRDYSTVINGRNPIIAHEYLGEDVEGKDIIISDDIISTGESMLDICKELKNRKAGRIFCSCTFGLFTQGIEAFNRAYEEGVIHRVLSTNLTYRTEELKNAPWYIDVDMSKYIAFIIATLNHDRSISRLLNPMQRINKLLYNYKEQQKANGFIY